MFLADVLKHLQILNLALQGKEKDITDFLQTILSFEAELIRFRSWEQDISSFSSSKSKCNQNQRKVGWIKRKTKNITS